MSSAPTDPRPHVPEHPLSGGHHGLGDPQSAGPNALEQLSNITDAGFCVAGLAEALARFCKPEIFNTDQSSQFTSIAFTSMLNEGEVRFSMGGRDRWMDSVFIARLWRALKDDWVCLHGFKTGAELNAHIGRWTFIPMPSVRTPA